MNKCKPILMLVASCAALALLGFATPESYERMPQRDKDAWGRCAGKVMAARLLVAWGGCAGKAMEARLLIAGGSMFTRYAIGGELMIEYSETPKHSRKRWLKRNGCPPHMVD
jgi:hypothetical protein